MHPVPKIRENVYNADVSSNPVEKSDDAGSGTNAVEITAPRDAKIQ